jgi:fructose-1,6-bisphosphatase II
LRRKTRAACQSAGLDSQQIFTANDLVSSDEMFFTATGITDGPLLTGVRYQGNQAETHSLLLRCETHTCQQIHAEHLIEADSS